jgi:hypothetical protein
LVVIGISLVGLPGLAGLDQTVQRIVGQREPGVAAAGQAAVGVVGEARCSCARQTGGRGTEFSQTENEPALT